MAQCGNWSHTLWSFDILNNMLKIKKFPKEKEELPKWGKINITKEMEMHFFF